MAYIIAEPCIGTKDTACVDVCPVDCIHPAKGRTYVRRRSQCTRWDRCTVEALHRTFAAIFPLNDLPEKQELRRRR